MIEPRLCVLFFPNGAELKPLAEACLQISPQVSVRGNEAIFIELASLKRIYSFHGIGLRLRAILKRFKLAPRIRWAMTAAEGLALARHNIFETAQLPVEALTDYYDPFFFDEVAQAKLSKICDTVHKLGITTLVEFKKLPPAELISRFGEEALEFCQNLYAQRPEVWPRFRVEERMIEAQELPDMPFFSTNVTLEPLMFVLRGLLDRITSRLRGRGLRVIKLALELEQERFSTVQEPIRRWEISFPLPQGSTSGCFTVMYEKLQHELTQVPLESSVIQMAIEILETTHGSYSQTDFLSKKEEETESWNALFARLNHKLGEGAAYYAHPVAQFLPEKSWGKSAAPPESGFSYTFPLRPTRLLATPILLHYRDGVFVAPGSHSRWRVTKSDGPERFMVEWWQKPVQRDYYQVLTDTGDALWIYFSPDEKQFYLHGYFD